MGTGLLSLHQVGAWRAGNPLPAVLTSATAKRETMRLGELCRHAAPCHFPIPLPGPVTLPPPTQVPRSHG